jgi:HEAT repeat protein
MTTPSTDAVSRLRAALHAADPSARLQAALTAGTHPDDRYVPVLIERAGVDADFSVRDTLTWALTRHSPAVSVPLLLAEVANATAPQARSQSLHTLSKVGDPEGWGAITDELLADAHDEVARSAWRAAVVLAPDAARPALAKRLADQLGRGDREMRRSLSRALATLGEPARHAVETAGRHGSDDRRAHALATRMLLDDPDADFDAAVFDAVRIVSLTSAPDVPEDADR